VVVYSGLPLPVDLELWLASISPAVAVAVAVGGQIFRAPLRGGAGCFGEVALATRLTGNRTRFVRFPVGRAATATHQKGVSP